MKQFIDKLIGRLEEKQKQTWLVLAERNGYARAIEIVNQLAEEFATDINVVSNGWIPCSERLPEEEGYYLITILFYHLHNPLVMGCQFEDGEWWKIDKDDKVIAWQPLPKPFVRKDD